MRGSRLEHPAVVRLCHWAGALAVFVLVSSGLEIFRAFPSFGDKIPQIDLIVPPAAITLGGWLGGALRWHFAFAWLFVASGATYLTYQLWTGNIWQVLFTPRDLAGVWPMVSHYFFSGPKPARLATYNPLQKLAYTAVISLGVAAAVTGAALYKPVQLSWLVTTLGGFRLTRIWHFATMCGLLAFIPGHLVMVARHGRRNVAAMWTGGDHVSREV